jgi:hypothetical protein
MIVYCTVRAVNGNGLIVSIHFIIPKMAVKLFVW